MTRPSESVTLADVVLAAVQSGLAEVHTAFPAVVVSYDRTTQKATVQPCVAGRYLDDDGELQSEVYPPLPNLPVAFPSATGFADTFDLTPGDSVQVVVCERSTDEWRSTGNQGIVAQDIRRFDLSDAFVIPGGRAFNEAIGATGYKAGARVIEAPEICLGSSGATNFVALANLVLSELQAIKTAYDLHTHTGVTAGVAVSGVPAVALPAPGSVACTKVKAE